MSSFYVLGHDENGKLIAMTSRAFPSMDEAIHYVRSCHPGLTPFVVERKPEKPEARHETQP